MSIILNFIDIIDRYLEVSNVYYQRLLDVMQKKDDTLPQVAERYDRLLTLLEDVDLDKPSSPIEITESKDTKGRTLVATKELLKQTDRFKEKILDRLKKRDFAGSVPRNINKLADVLGLRAEEYLGYFQSVSYAWDILTELNSLLSLPNSKALAGRDMIHMHVVELQIHLTKVIARIRLVTPEYQVKLTGSFPVKELNFLQTSKQLVEKMIEFAVPRNPNDLLEEIEPLVSESPIIYEIIKKDYQKVLSFLNRGNRTFTDTLKDDYPKFQMAHKTCDELVIFGLNVAYATWYPFAKQNAIEEGSLRKNILFCTRILLDEGRWNVCRAIAKTALIISEELKNGEGKRELQGTGMLTANLFFSRKMCGENITGEVEAWDTSDIDQRYTFLKLILLEKFNDAAELATNILNDNNEKSSKSLIINEIKEWPILADFRESKEGINVINNAK